MARRRRIETPTEADLARIEEAAAEPEGAPKRPPIAQIAGEAAALNDPAEAGVQAQRARDMVDARALRRARDEGWEVVELPLSSISTDGMTRDRMAMDPEAMEELRQSLRLSGLRMPIEVMMIGEGEYALVSGLRRLMAMRDISNPAGTIHAFVRPDSSEADRFVAMVEENEIRADLSSYERGRAVVSAVEDGAFLTLEDAVDEIFATASKAKRSKVRSFALVHEELGDLLTFPQSLSERHGLKVAAALRNGGAADLRQALATGQPGDAAAEWALLEAAIKGVPVAAKAKARPKTASLPPVVSTPVGETVKLANGVTMRHEQDAGGHVIRLSGRVVDDGYIAEIMDEIERLLEPI